MPGFEVVTVTVRPSMSAAVEVRVLAQTSAPFDENLTLAVQSGFCLEGDPWTSDIAPHDARLLWNLLDNFRISGVLSNVMGLDGTTYVLEVNSGMASLVLEWWETAPDGWADATRLANELVRLAGPDVARSHDTAQRELRRAERDASGGGEDISVSERDKMLRGHSYDASDPELVEARAAARRLTLEFNALDPSNVDESNRVLELLLGEYGAGSWVEPPFHCDYGANTRFGSRVYVNMACVFLDAAPITMGDDAQLGPGVQLLTSDHPRDAVERSLGLESALPISIGERSWLGGGVIVLPGVSIGAETVIGAGSVVTRSIPDGVVAAGNPCRIVEQG